MSACPVGPEDRTGVVKIFAFLELEQKYLFFKGLFLSAKCLLVFPNEVQERIMLFIFILRVYINFLCLRMAFLVPRSKKVVNY